MLAALLVPVTAIAEPLSGPAPDWRAIPPQAVIGMARARGLEPLGVPMRRGSAYVLPAEDVTGRPVRVLVDARTGGLITVEPMRRPAPLHAARVMQLPDVPFDPEDYFDDAPRPPRALPYPSGRAPTQLLRRPGPPAARLSALIPNAQQPARPKAVAPMQAARTPPLPRPRPAALSQAAPATTGSVAPAAPAATPPAKFEPPKPAAASPASKAPLPPVPDVAPLDM